MTILDGGTLDTGTSVVRYHAPYQRIEADLRHKVRTGVWQPGTVLPSRRQLAEEYSVSLGTVERAISNLLSDGTLTARDRRGTFVAKQSTNKTPDQDAAPTLPAASSRPPIIATFCPVTKPINDDHEPISSWQHAIVDTIERRIAMMGGRSRFVPVPVERLGLGDDLIIGDGILAKVDGIVFVFIDELLTKGLVSLENKSIPCVYVNGSERLMEQTSVCYDNRDAGYRAARHLIEQGCRSIQFFAPYTADFVSARRIGISEAVSQSKDPDVKLTAYIRPDTIQQVVDQHDSNKGERPFGHRLVGYEWAREVLSTGMVPDGVVASNDLNAVGFLDAAAEQGLQAGRDYSIISFDDSPTALTRGLTSMRPPLESMGDEALRLILEAIRGNETGRKVTLHSQLIVRDSSRRDDYHHSFWG